MLLSFGSPNRGSQSSLQYFLPKRNYWAEVRNGCWGNSISLYGLERERFLYRTGLDENVNFGFSGEGPFKIQAGTTGSPLELSSSEIVFDSIEWKSICLELLQPPEFPPLPQNQTAAIAMRCDDGDLWRRLWYCCTTSICNLYYFDLHLPVLAATRIFVEAATKSEQPQMPEKKVQMIDGSQWNIWSAIDELEAVQQVFYPELTPRIVAILREWGEKWCGHPEWRSMLNKNTLHKEVEESIVAIHHLLEATSDREEKSIIVMDICAGKGLFSFLLSYLKPPHVKEIIMLEKAAINWYHIREGANPTAQEEGRPYITIWENTNLHDYDDVLDRILELPLPVAMTGIHLCKQLGPSFCGLVNGLGSKCIYACLAPCCLPRAITAQKGKSNEKSWLLAIQLQETQEERQSRRDYMDRRGRMKRKPRNGPCFHCNDETHGLIDCPILPTLPVLEQERIRRAFHKATIPCWNCLAYGHYKQICPQVVERSNPLALSAPQMELDVSQVLSSDKPYHKYCYMLAECFQDRTHEVIETDLENTEKHQDGNWNSERKSIFIVAR